MLSGGRLLLRVLHSALCSFRGLLICPCVCSTNC